MPPSYSSIASYHVRYHRQAGFVYRAMATYGIPRGDIELTQQLTLYNDMFGWARVAYLALADQSPPDILYGPSAQGLNDQLEGMLIYPLRSFVQQVAECYPTLYESTVYPGEASTRVAC